MKYKDYYEVLGLPRSATQDDIKRTYRKLARKYHPDLSKLDDAEPRFKEVGEAYSVLKDTEKRAAYDRMGDQWRNGQDFEPPPQWDEGFEFSGGEDRGAEDARFSEFFEALFRGEHARHATSTRARIFQVMHHERIAHWLARMPDRRGAGGVHATRIVPGVRCF
ncbi:Curved DNA-binding protein [Paraburkholderia nemoris]|nr:J domain-containing protein [Paraburkholderia aspalathi]MBK5153372.1 J domain-containing protein [Burkholderia sp. R-69608]CAE6689338.1 Curved DNA-binding protein [Paraburkholderia nemoris]MBK3779680.1 J domain-containing protein [Paraburkholderia aspalathi]CAE6856375.1 Curved DNA-binding protein [Paraburkholderia nemoris]